MNRRLVAVSGVLALSLFATREATAAKSEAVVQKVTVLNRAAVAAYSDGDFDKMKVKLNEAVALGKDVIPSHPMLARTYLHLGVLWVDGFENRAKGVAFFVKALKINPAIEITAGMATKSVMSAFEEAHTQAGAADDDSSEEAPAKASSEKASEKAAAPERSKADDRAAAELAQAKETASHERADKEQLQRDTKKLVAEAKQQLLQAEGESKKEVQRAEAEAKKLVVQAEAEHKKELQQAEAEHKKELQQAEAEHKRQLQQADKEKGEKDKQIADGNLREKKERDAKEKLEKQLQDRDKQLADAKQALVEAKLRTQLLEKEKADRDKQIADGNLREKKERDAKEKLEKEKAAADARDKERKANEDKERAEREKMAAGPEFPAHIPEPLFCAVPEEAPAGADLYVHCAAQPNVKAKTITFYYRPSGFAVYSSIVMEPSKHGWHMAMIPANKVAGKLIQYYAEARDAKQAVAAATGKASSPNILTLKPAGRGK